MATKWSLTTKRTVITGSATGTDLGMGSVAQGKKRFITYIGIYCPTNTNEIQLGSAPAAASGISLIKFKRRVNDTFEYPDRPDVDHPLFAIGAGGYLGCLGITGVGDTEVTVQYYDE